LLLRAARRRREAEARVRTPPGRPRLEPRRGRSLLRGPGPVRRPPRADRVRGRHALVRAVSRQRRCRGLRQLLWPPGTERAGFRVRLHGPCFRCLEDAVLDLPISAREYQATASEVDEELRTPYLEDDRLDLSAWARDALALELPDKILCRADCAGLCPVCGKNLNDEPHEHDEHEADPRWAALAELRDRL